jgi:hypothetical protein
VLGKLSRTRNTPLSQLSRQGSKGIAAHSLTHARPPPTQGVETRKTETMYIMAVISLGVCIASYGTHTHTRSHTLTHTIRKRIAHPHTLISHPPCAYRARPLTRHRARAASQASLRLC